MHGFPFFCLLVDFCLNVVPFIHRHLIWTMLTALSYLLINLGTFWQTKFGH